MASILVVDDEHSFSVAVAEFLRGLDHQVTTVDTLQLAREQLGKQPTDVLLVDLMLPDGNGLELLDLTGSAAPKRIIVITGHRGLKSTIRDMQGPELHFLVKPLDMALLVPLCDLSLDHGTHNRHFNSLIGNSKAMQQVYQLIRQVAPTDTNVMIVGESGTGKELVAEALHKESHRSGPFLPVNCGGLTAELIASELFGHEKGSFTGATTRHIGAFERATDGTLFLDEITEMPLVQQPHLLRALENREITRVGGSAPVSVSTRIVAATNRAVQSAVAEGKLREDLYFRLGAFPIELPPLRERKDDIPLLVAGFLDDFNRQFERELSVEPEQLQRLQDWHWPGNVRELRHTLHRCVISTPKAEDTLRIPEELEVLPLSGEQSFDGRTLREVEREAILATLSRCNGNRNQTAESLGVSAKTLYNRLAEYRAEGIDVQPFDD